VIAMLTAEALGDAGRRALDPACAIEMVHTASLILDDMPFMDDASLRRGRAANHCVHGIDLAALASISLLNRAFAVTAQARDLDDSLRVELIGILSRMIGDEGIVAGQVRDLHHSKQRCADPSEVERMAREKTGALFVGAAELGARVARAPEAWVEAARAYALNLGMCFQVLDDLLDLQHCPRSVRKDVGKDRHKVNFVATHGQPGAKELAERYLGAAVQALRPVGSRAAGLERFAFGLLGVAPAQVAGT